MTESKQFWYDLVLTNEHDSNQAGGIMWPALTSGLALFSTMVVFVIGVFALTTALLMLYELYIREPNTGPDDQMLGCVGPILFIGILLAPTSGSQLIIQGLSWVFWSLLITAASGLVCTVKAWDAFDQITMAEGGLAAEMPETDLKNQLELFRAFAVVSALAIFTIFYQALTGL